MGLIRGLIELVLGLVELIGFVGPIGLQKVFELLRTYGL